MERAINNLAEAVSSLACAMKSLQEQTRIEFEWHRSHHGFATKQDIEKLGKQIMEAITKFSDSVNQSFDKLGLAVEGVTNDIAALKTEIEKLQNSPGTLTAEDQALLDSIQNRANDAANKLAALDALTEQVPTPPGT